MAESDGLLVLRVNLAQELLSLSLRQAQAHLFEQVSELFLVNDAVLVSIHRLENFHETTQKLFVFLQLIPKHNLLKFAKSYSRSLLSRTNKVSPGSLVLTLELLQLLIYQVLFSVELSF